MTTLRQVSDNHNIYALSMAPGSESILYFQIKSSSQVMIAPTFWKEHNLYPRQMTTGRSQGLLYGFLAGLLLLTLGLYLRMKKKSTLYFCAYTLTIGLFFSMIDGLFQQTLWPSALSWSTGPSIPESRLQCALVLLEAGLSTPAIFSRGRACRCHCE